MRTQLVAIALAIAAWSPCAWGNGAIFGERTYFPVEGQGVFTQAVAGDFDGNRMPDAAFVRAGHAYYVSSPELYGAQTPYKISGQLAPTVTAIAVLPGPVRDELLMASNLGLSAWTRNENSTFTVRTLGNTKWTYASALAVGPAGAIYGLSEDGVEFGVLTDTTENWYPLPRVATDLTVFDWEADSIDEIALATATGVDVISPTGVLGTTFMATNPVADVVTIREAGAFDRIAYVGKGLGGVDDWLAVVGNQTFPTILVLGDLDVVALAVGDLDLDGKDDLFLSQQADPSQPDLLFNLGSAAYPSFSLGASQHDSQFDSYVSANNQHQPILSDVDSDGDLDLVFFEEAEGNCWVSHNDTIEATSLMPSISEFSYQPQYQLGHFCIATLPPAEGIPLGATQLEVVLWEMPDPLGMARTNSVPKIFSGDNAEMAGEQLHKLTFETPNGASGLTSLYFCGLRYVEQDTQGYRRIYPMRLVGFTTRVVDNQVSQPLIDLLSGFSGANGGAQLVTTVSPGDPESYGITGDLEDPINTGSNTPVRPLPGTNNLPEPKP